MLIMAICLNGRLSPCFMWPDPSLYEGKENLVEVLLDQVREYDVYAEAGCCKWAYDHEDIARTQHWLAEGQ